MTESRLWTQVRISRVFCLSFVIVLLGSAATAGTPEALCREIRLQPDRASKSLDEKLDAKSRFIETKLATEGESITPFKPASLDVDPPPDSDPAPDARAAYCSAIGELARRGLYETTFDAPGYLLVAFLSADRSHANDVSARAAYRLGLALAVSPIGDGGRGARAGGGRDPTASPRRALLKQPRGEAACEELDALSTGFDAFTATASQALACAAARAWSAGDRDLSALSDLRRVRLLLASTEAASADGAEVRGMAGDLAASSLTRTGGPPAPELTARLAEAAIDAGRAPDAGLMSSISAIEDSPSADVGARAYAAALRGRVMLWRGKPAAAAALLQRAIFLESQRALPSRLADWYMLLSEADPENRAAHVRSAYIALDNVRRRLPIRDPLTEESTFDLHMRRVFEAAVSDALSSLSTSDPNQSPSIGSQQDTVEIAAVQSIVENYRQAELQNAFGNACLSEVSASKVQKLQPDEIVLYPIVLPDRVEILYMNGGDGQFHRLPPNVFYDREKVAALVSAMRLSITRTHTGWKAPSRELYDLLIRPIDTQLRTTDTLVVIPDATLSALPFAALSDAKGRFLIEKTRLDIAPGLAYAQPGSTRAGKRAFVVAGSLDRDVDLSFGRFNRLGAAPAEARFAAGLEAGEGGVRGLYIKDFTRETLAAALRRHRVDVLHLATHASFNGGTDKSFIVANGDFISLTDLRQIISTNRAFGNDLDLLVLSACETAVGDDRSSLGLAGAAVQSGARGAVASLWPVNDQTTAQLMRGFYRSYRHGAAKAEAMQSTQLAMLSMAPKGAMDFRDPYYWASLILVGGWR